MSLTLTFEIGVNLLGNKTTVEKMEGLRRFEIGVNLLGNKTLGGLLWRNG